MVGMDWAEESDGFDDFRSSLPELTPEEEAYWRDFVDRLNTPLAPGAPRRHHFIPQFFLKRFADDDAQLAVVRLDDLDHYQTIGVENIAVMKDLYTIVDNELRETVAVEKLLAMSDGDAKSAIDRLAFGLFFPPQINDRLAICVWIAFLHVRDPYTRRQMEAIADQTFKMDLSLVHDVESARSWLRERSGVEPSSDEIQDLLSTVDELNEFEAVPHQNELVKIMLDSAMSLLPHLLRRRYAVIRFHEDGLVLCDNPLVLYREPAKRSPLVGVGPINADEIWLPLDRRTGLVLHSDDRVGDVVLDAPPHHSVDDFNQAVVLGANAEVYCHPDDLHRLDDLDYPDADRPLFEVSGNEWMKGATDGINAPAIRKRHLRYRRFDKDKDLA